MDTRSLRAQRFQTVSNSGDLNMEWSTVDCLNLIAVYQQHPILWNPRHRLHSNKDRKQDAWVTIARMFGCSPRDVRKKIDSLLRSYRREKMRARNIFGNGSGGHETYISSWYAYDRMSFLDDKLESRNSQSSTDIDQDSFKSDDPLQTKDESEQESLNEALWAVEAVYQPEITTVSDEPDLVQGLQRHLEPVGAKGILDKWNVSEVTEKPRSKRSSNWRPSLERQACNSEDPRDNEVLNTLIASRSHSHGDNCATYAQYIGNKLRDYDKRTKAIVEYHINNILFQADMGQFESRVFEQSHRFNTFR